MMMSASDGRSSAETSIGSDSRQPLMTAMNSQDSHASTVFGSVGSPTDIFANITEGTRTQEEQNRQKLQEQLAEYQEQLQCREHDIAEIQDDLKNFEKQLKSGIIDSDQFECRTRKFTQTLESLESDRTELRRRIDESIPDPGPKPIVQGTSKDHTKVGAEPKLTMTKSGLDEYVQEAIAQALYKQSMRTIGELRTALGEAYVEQSKISDRITLLMNKRSTRNSSKQDEDEILKCEEELRVNTDHITQLEREIPNARPNDPQIGSKPPSSIIRLNNIPSSAHTSRQTSPSRKSTQQSQLTSDTAKPTLKTADDMSTPVDPAETARKLQAAVETQRDGDQAQQPQHATHLHGPATTRQQVVHILDRVRDGAPGSQRLSMGTGTLYRTRHNMLNTNKPATIQEDIVVQTQSSAKPTVKPSSVSSSSSDIVRVRQALPGYAKSVAPITFSGKPGQDVTRFLKQMDRYLRRAEIDNEEEMTEHLHKYLSEEIRTSLMNALTEATEYDYAAQVEFLRCWWGRTRDPRPLMDEYQKITYTQSEDLDSYASRVERGRRAGWPHESTIRHNGFHSEYEKSIMEGFLRGLPKNLRQIIHASGKLDDIELHQSDFKELVEFTRIQMRNLAKKERLHCNECGRGCGHETIDCPRKQRVNAVSEGSENATPLMDIAQANWDDSDVAQLEQACAMIKPATTNQRPFPQQTQPFRQPRPMKPDFLREQQARNNFQAGGNNRGNNQRFGNTAGQKRFEGCYNCGQLGHLIAQCPHPLKAKMPQAQTDLGEILQSLDVIRKAIFLKIHATSGSQAVRLQQEAKAIDLMISSIQDNLETPEENDIVDPADDPDSLNK